MERFGLDKNYDPLTRKGAWDAKTRATVEGRIKEETATPVAFSFLSLAEGKLLTRLVDILLPQVAENQKIIIATVIDACLSETKAGVRYNNDPWRSDFYRRGLTELAGFALGNLEEFIKTTMDGPDIFAKRFLRRVLYDAAAVYYSHPAAWQEIGFPGPAYPEGYGLLGCGEKETWEPGYGNK